MLRETYLNCFFKSKGFTDGLDIESEKKEEVKDGSGKDGVAVTWHGKDYGNRCEGGRWVQFWVEVWSVITYTSLELRERSWMESSICM